MPLAQLTVKGLRGYSTPQQLNLAVPSGVRGSGLTLIVGANGSGKTTLVEALQFLQRLDMAPPFPDSKRNSRSGGQVSVQYMTTTGEAVNLETAQFGGGDARWSGSLGSLGSVWVVPPRRVLPEGSIPSGAQQDRASHIKGLNPGQLRTSYYGNFAPRLTKAAANQGRFNACFSRIVDPPPAWYITEPEPNVSDGGRVVRFVPPSGKHSSDGVSEGFASLFWIVDGLYDSEPGELIVIDEPELSLHPALQRRLAGLVADLASDRQIVLATHSPYFADLNFVFAGAELSRVSADRDGSKINRVRRETVDALRSQANDQNNPHVMGLDAREAFFLEDGIILTEGQDDVLYYPRLAAQLGLDWGGTFFGWGVGGIDKMHRVAQLFYDLGFRRVVGLVDGGQEKKISGLRSSFPDYTFLSGDARDVRTKDARPARRAVHGLADDSGRLRPEYEDRFREMVAAARAALGQRSKAG